MPLSNPEHVPVVLHFAQAFCRRTLLDHALLGRGDFAGLVVQIVTGVATCYVCTRHRELIYPILLAADRAPRVLPGRPLHPWVRLRRKWREWCLTRAR